MDYNEFVARVREAARIDTEENTRRIIAAIMETFGERLPRTHRNHLAAQLPGELKSSLLKLQTTSVFPLAEFYNRAGARAKIAYPHIIGDTRAVMDVLSTAVAAGELNDILAQFPAEYDELFGKRPESPLSPSSLTVKEERHLEKTEHGRQKEL